MEALAGYGADHEHIARLIINPRTGKPITAKTLRKVFRGREDIASRLAPCDRAQGHLDGRQAARWPGTPSFYRRYFSDLSAIEVVSQDVSRMLLNLISNGFYAVTERGREGDGAYQPVLKITTRESKPRGM